MNHYLAERSLHVKPEHLLTGELANGIILCNLLELVGKSAMVRWNEEPKTRLDDIAYLSLQLNYIIIITIMRLWTARARRGMSCASGPLH